MSLVSTLPVAFEPAVPLLNHRIQPRCRYHPLQPGVVHTRDRDGNGRLARCTGRIRHRVNKGFGQGLAGHTQCLD